MKTSTYIDTGADISRNRHRGNKLSVAAFDISSPHHKHDALAVYGLICASPNGITSKEIAERMGKPLHSVSGRLSELKADGKIRGTGERRDGAEVLVAVTGEQQSFQLTA